jgi:hypothetical protein
MRVPVNVDDRQDNGVGQHTGRGGGRWQGQKQRQHKNVRKTRQFEGSDGVNSLKV